MKAQTQNLLKLLPLVLATIGFASCDVKKTEEGNLPDVDIEVKGDAKLPKYDIDAPDVDVKTKKVEVEVPTIEITPAGEDTNDK